MSKTSASRRDFLLNIATGGGALAFTIACFPARAVARQSGQWPVRPVKVVVPTSAGSQTDLFARFIAEHLGKAFGQPFIVENRPGGSGTIGTRYVVRSAPDGYTLLFSASSFTVVPSALYPDLPYDLLKDLTPVAQVGAGGNFLAVPAASPLVSPGDMFDYARAHPDTLTYGTTGVGSVTHITMTALLRQQSARMRHIPYKAGSEVVRDLMGGVLPVGWVDTTNGNAAARAGKIRLLAVTGTYRMPRNPEVATLPEQGFGIKQDGWLGLFAPAGVPASIVRDVNAEVNRLTSSTKTREQLTMMNVAGYAANRPEQFTDTVRNDLRAWRKIIVDNDIHAD